MRVRPRADPRRVSCARVRECRKREARMKTVHTAVVLVILVLYVAAGQTEARSHHHRTHKPAPPKSSSFYYYVLSLSWSPEHCKEKPGGPDDSQCGTARHFGFVVHGLWPQYENGGYPQTCANSNKLTPDVISGMLDIMPSE